jgi:hypothetical protein
MPGRFLDADQNQGAYRVSVENIPPWPRDPREWAGDSESGEPSSGGADSVMVEQGDHHQEQRERTQ